MAEQHQEYPRLLYHHKYAPEGEIFQSAEETQGLERKDWVDTPKKFPKKSKVEFFCERAKKSINKFWREKGQRISTIRLNYFYIVMTLCIALSLYFINK